MRKLKAVVYFMYRNTVRSGRFPTPTLIKYYLKKGVQIY